MKDFKHYLSIVNESMSNSYIQQALMKQIDGMTPELASEIETKMNEKYSRGKTRDTYAARKGYSFIFYTMGNQKEKKVYDIAKEDLAVEASNEAHYQYDSGEVKVKGKTYVFAYIYNALKAQGLPPRYKNMYDSEPGIEPYDKYE